MLPAEHLHLFGIGFRLQFNYSRKWQGLFNCRSIISNVKLIDFLRRRGYVETFLRNEAAPPLAQGSLK
jgi:hypothetical protein